MSILSVLSLNAQAYSPEACVKVLGKAKESIKVIIPDIRMNFFWDDKIIDALKQAVGRGVAVKVAHGEHYRVGKLGILSVPGIEVFRLKKSYDRLLISVDAKHAVIEQSNPVTRGSERGIITPNAKLLAQEYDAFFDELIVACESISKKDSL